MKRGTPRHPKTKDLARRLKVPLPHAVGILEMLWHFTADFCPLGDIGRHSDLAIADAVGWPEQDCGSLITALCESRWLNVVETPDRLIVHDWHEHADDYTKKKIKESGKVFASLQKILENSGKFTATLPYPALPNQSQSQAAKEPTVTPVLDEQFQEFKRLFEAVGNPIDEDFANGSFCWRAWSILDYHQRKAVIESLRERQSAGVSVLHKPDNYLTRNEWKRKIAAHVNGRQRGVMEGV